VNHRLRELKTYDDQSNTLSEALQAVLQSAADFSLKKQQEMGLAENVLLEKSNKLRYEKSLTQRELVLREKLLYDENIENNLNSISNNLYTNNSNKDSNNNNLIALYKNNMQKKALKEYNSFKQYMQEQEYTTQQSGQRWEDRQQLYDYYDYYCECFLTYYEKKDEKDMNIVIGIDLDHIARFEDYIKTEEGKLLYSLQSLLQLLQLPLHQIQQIQENKNIK